MRRKSIEASREVRQWIKILRDIIETVKVFAKK